MPVSASDAVSVDPAPAPASRERRLDARRNLEAIVDAARRAFAADPGASMQEVAAAAGLHRATVHRHFASREDLVAALRRRAFEEAIAALREAALPEGPAPEALARGTRALLGQAERWQLSRYSTSLEMTPVTDEMSRMLTEVLARGQRDGTVRDDVEAGLLAVMWTGMVSANRVLRERGLSTDAATDVVVRTLLGPGA